MCPEHEMEKVNMYCEVCKRPVCHLCKLGGSHANHKVTSMSSAYKILKVPNSHTVTISEKMIWLLVCACPLHWSLSVEYTGICTILTYDNKD